MLKLKGTDVIHSLKAGRAFINDAVGIYNMTMKGYDRLYPDLHDIVEYTNPLSTPVPYGGWFKGCMGYLLVSPVIALLWKPIMWLGNMIATPFIPVTKSKTDNSPRKTAIPLEGDSRRCRRLAHLQ